MNMLFVPGKTVYRNLFKLEEISTEVNDFYCLFLATSWRGFVNFEVLKIFRHVNNRKTKTMQIKIRLLPEYQKSRKLNIIYNGGSLRLVQISLV